MLNVTHKRCVGCILQENATLKRQLSALGSAMDAALAAARRNTPVPHARSSTVYITSFNVGRRSAGWAGFAAISGQGRALARCASTGSLATAVKGFSQRLEDARDLQESCIR